ncbi:MAG TPA: SNF2-related protein [Thermoanaerobaculia bacterium]|nr:SNF2-related protein [Thermoanaerobaculia bacterium]
MPAFRENDKLFHKFNPDLGPGRVEKVDGRRIVVFFPATETRLTLAADDAALRPLPFGAGQKARIEGEEGEVLVAAVEASGVRLSDGRTVNPVLVWPLAPPDDPVERLAALQSDRAAAFRNRLDGLLLAEVRQAAGLGSFLGGRIALYPHQLDVAERATASDPVRWLLADEVGLGKTIEACLILSRLLRTDRADRALVVAPATLTVQWLGELYRKFHQTFVLLDRKRREDVVKEHGRGFNPFEAHRHAIIAIDDLVADPRLSAQAEAAGFELLVVDEAHRLERARGEPGSDAYRAVAPLARAARHVLLLSAAPLEADPHGFFRLIELLRPDAYTSEEQFLAALGRGEPLPPCTSATRRVDVGGFQPRVPAPVDLESLPPAGPLADAQAAADPRIAWLAKRDDEWRAAGTAKTLVFVHERDTLSALKARLESATLKRVAIFHEGLTPERGDVEVAEFRRPDGPSLLISTEAGGEGRNFEFCRRLVLFDLPRDPAEVEQRIGRLDRINRTTPVEIVYFRPPDGFEREIADLYERIGLFTSPLGGLERSLGDVEAAIRKAERFAKVGRRLPVEALAAEVRSAADARRDAVYHHLHQNGYRVEKAAEILSRVPADLDARMERFVLDAADLHGFETQERAGKRTWYVEFGADALVEHLPGVPGGSRWLGTFDRGEAVLKEDLDFFASGHALVEGIFRELQDGARGRVGLLLLDKAGASGAGLLFVFRHGAGVEAVAVGFDGTPRPDLAALILRRRSEARGVRPEDWLGILRKAARGRTPDWPSLVRRLSRRALADRKGRKLEAVAAFRLMR